ncbi:MAG: hypothetical protein L0J68_04035 [Micrococcaceae bacterium]|uniref:hypothetical protein n=1 Tax=unclassified Arthrobacter TaxID=235627 RepID=UPI0026565554|nr:hypothetical protein [Micrococcaceae bacterium]MDN5812714.1 hypothetical protein [Micrococcaceae bacterium]MDN5824607.1 hypothetical protein [Micrococcaceae bacterium]MDN5880034.1 hypothetical protein [Micrococcaceae bacterium]MDN5886965.1 hypothetical protein [Micrococcaceae bacterium]
MCRAVKCRKCQKTTWAGCGQHVQQVMANVPRADRCSCDPNAPKDSSASGGWLSRLFKRTPTNTGG